MNKPIPKYFNPKQIECMAIAAKNEFIVASRRFGKSEGIDAPRMLRNVQAMPGSMGALLSPTYGKLLKNTLPAVSRALARMGYYRDVHYYINRKPPVNSGFAKPIIEPFSYDNVIAWYNGSINVLVSFDRSMSVNSMTLDYIMGFEAKFLDYTKIKDEVIPANSPDDQKKKIFGDCPWYNGQVFTTDMPTTSRGKWIFDKESQMSPKLIELIKNTYISYKYYQSLNTPYGDKVAKLLYKELNRQRKDATFYAEYNVYDNIDILGQEYIDNMRRELPPLVFAVSIENKRMKKIKNGFYSAFDDTIHTYEAIYHNHILDAMNYDLDISSRQSCAADADITDTEPLEIAFDYNAAINNLVVGQKYGNRMRTVKHFWLKTPDKLKELVQGFCSYYSSRINRDIIFYFDSTAIARSASSDYTFADEVQNILIANSFNVTPIYIGQPVSHQSKHQQIDNALKRDPAFLFPQFNEDHCSDLIIAIQQTGVKIGPNGFQKDKSLEKKPDDDESPDQHKTHGTDAWDTLFIGMNHHRPASNKFFMPSGKI